MLIRAKNCVINDVYYLTGEFWDDNGECKINTPVRYIGIDNSVVLNSSMNSEYGKYLFQSDNGENIYVTSNTLLKLTI